MNAEELLRERRSVRDYQDREVSEELLENIVDIGRLAPSGNNVQPWEMVIVTDREKLDRLAELKGQKPGFPACIVVFVREEGLYVRDASALTTYLNLAAEAKGLASCWVNVYEKEYEDEIKNMLNAPDELKLFSYVTVGYPAEEPCPDKRELEDVLHREKF